MFSVRRISFGFDIARQISIFLPRKRIHDLGRKYLAGEKATGDGVQVWEWQPSHRRYNRRSSSKLTGGDWSGHFPWPLYRTGFCITVAKPAILSIVIVVRVITVNRAGRLESPLLSAELALLAAP
jgi:hypothetical protein